MHLLLSNCAQLQTCVYVWRFVCLWRSPVVRPLLSFVLHGFYFENFDALPSYHLAAAKRCLQTNITPITTDNPMPNTQGYRFIATFGISIDEWPAHEIIITFRLVRSKVQKKSNGRLPVAGGDVRSGWWKSRYGCCWHFCCCRVATCAESHRLNCVHLCWPSWMYLRHSHSRPSGCHRWLFWGCFCCRPIASKRSDRFPAASPRREQTAWMLHRSQTNDCCYWL